MNEIQIFKSDSFGAARTAEVDGTPYFVGKDVAEILGYSDPQKAIKMHVYDEDKLTRQIVVSGQNRNVIMLNESGVYALVFGSKLPKAKEFKHWVTSEILPTIRKHGAYMTENTLEKALTSPDFLIQLATQLKEEQAKYEKNMRAGLRRFYHHVVVERGYDWDELVAKYAHELD